MVHNYRGGAPGSITGKRRRCFLMLGSFFDQLGERERAEEASHRGVEMLEPTVRARMGSYFCPGPKLEAYPDDVRTRSSLRLFLGASWGTRFVLG